MKKLLLASLFSMAFSSWALEDISPEVIQYLQEHSTPAADAQWKAKVMARINQMLADDPSLSGPEAAAEKLGFNFFADHKNQYEEKRLTKAIKIETCRMYILFREQNWSFPARVHEDISKTKFRHWMLETGEK